MAAKPTSSIPGVQDVTSSRNPVKRSGPRGKEGWVTSRGGKLAPMGEENPEQSTSKVSPKEKSSSGLRRTGSLRLRAGLTTPRRYISDSDDDDDDDDSLERLQTPSRRQPGQDDGHRKSSLDGKKKEGDDMDGAASMKTRRHKLSGKSEQKSLEIKGRGKKRRRDASSDSNVNTEKPQEEENSEMEKVRNGEGEIPAKHPKLRAGPSGAAPRAARRGRRKVQVVRTGEGEDQGGEEGLEEEEEKDSQKDGQAGETLMSTWRQELEEKGQCVCPKCTCCRRTAAGMWKHYNTCRGKAAHPCSQCEAKFNSAAGLRYHLMSAHATSPGPRGEVDEEARLKYILKRVGKLQCKNEGCSSKYTTLHGYKYHIQRCGKAQEDREIFKCDECEKTYLSVVGLRLHKRTIHTPEPQTVAEEADTTTEDSGKGQETPERSKRQAATKALQHLQELLVDGLEKTNKQSREHQTERGVKQLYSSPKLDMTPQQAKLWARDIQDVGSVKCPYQECTKTYNSLPGLKGHLPQCEKRPEGVGGPFKCLQCLREFRSQAGVEYHVTKAHMDCVGDSGSEEEYSLPRQGDVSSSEEFVSDESEEDDDSKQHVTPRSKMKVRPVSYKPLRQPRGWVHAWRQQKHSPEVFPEWRPRKDQLAQLSLDGVHQYLPMATHSLPIIVKGGDDSDEAQGKSMALFESLSVKKGERSVTFFVGGPVWGAEWCPTAGPGAVQYAAISCHQHMGAKHEINKVSMEAGMIQLWCLGGLKNSSSSISVPFMSLGLAHKFGAVWDMKWCPSGAWDPPQWDPSHRGRQEPPRHHTDSASTCNGHCPPGQDSPGLAALPRLGLLALACSDGRVRIISIAHPEALQPIAEEQAVSHDALGHIFLVEPVVQLVVSKSGLHGNQPSNEHGQCFTVAWQPDEGHRRLAAGFYDGTVCLWDLQSQSALLRVPAPSAQPTLVLKNYLIFCAHDWVVTSVVWSETNTACIATGSLDRNIKLWNLQAPMSPIQQTKWCPVHMLAWPMHFPGVFAAVDSSCYARSNMRSVHFLSASCHDDNNRTLPITHHSSTTWGVSYNPWLNCIVSSDAAGQVVGTACPILDELINKAFFRFPVYTVDLQPSKGSPPLDTSDPSCVPQMTAMNTEVSQQQHPTTERADGMPCDQAGANATLESTPADKEAASIIRGQRTVLTHQHSAALSSTDHGTQERRQPGHIKPSGWDGINMTGTSQHEPHSVGVNDVQKSTHGAQSTEPLSDKCHSALSLPTSRLAGTSTASGHQENRVHSRDTESVVHQDHPIATLGSQVQGGRLAAKIAVDQWAVEDDTVVPLSGCSDQEFSRTDSESDGPTQHMAGKPSGTSCTEDTMQSHDAFDLSQNASDNCSHTSSTTSVLTNGLAVFDNSQSSMQQMSSGTTLDNSMPTVEFGKRSETGTTKQEKGSKRRLQTYEGLVGNHTLVFKDADLTSFNEDCLYDPDFLKLRKLDSMKDSLPDRTTVEAVHKVAWNPNPGCHVWLLSAGQAGVVRVHCIMGLLKTPDER